MDTMFVGFLGKKRYLERYRHSKSCYCLEWNSGAEHHLKVTLYHFVIICSSFEREFSWIARPRASVARSRASIPAYAEMTRVTHGVSASTSYGNFREVQLRVNQAVHRWRCRQEGIAASHSQTYRLLDSTNNCNIP